MVSEKLWQDAIEEIQILRRRVQELEEKLRRLTSETLTVEPDPTPTPPQFREHNCSGCMGC